jgi:hypothetical protein
LASFVAKNRHNLHFVAFFASDPNDMHGCAPGDKLLMGNPSLGQNGRPMGRFQE